MPCSFSSPLLRPPSIAASLSQPRRPLVGDHLLIYCLVYIFSLIRSSLVFSHSCSLPSPHWTPLGPVCSLRQAQIQVQPLHQSNRRRLHAACLHSHTAAASRVFPLLRPPLTVCQPTAAAQARFLALLSSSPDPLVDSGCVPVLSVRSRPLRLSTHFVASPAPNSLDQTPLLFRWRYRYLWTTLHPLFIADNQRSRRRHQLRYAPTS